MERGRGLLREDRDRTETEEEACGLFFNEIPGTSSLPKYTELALPVVSSHYCMFVFIAFKPLWEMYTEYMMLVKKERKLFISFPMFLLTHINIHRHTQREISRQGALQWISVLTQVIAFQLGGFWVLIQLDKVCSWVHDSENGVLSAHVVSAPARTTSMERKLFQFLTQNWCCEYKLLFEHL